MVFSWHLFVFGFLPLALLAYHASPARARNLVLTLFSYLRARERGWSMRNAAAIMRKVQRPQ